MNPQGNTQTESQKIANYCCDLAIESLKRAVKAKNLNFVLVGSYTAPDGNTATFHTTTGSLDAQIGLLDAKRLYLSKMLANHFETNTIERF